MMQQNHEWYVDLIPAYAIGAADPDERVAVDAHLKGCADCRALLEEYRGLGEDLAFAAPVAYAPAGLTEDLRKRTSVRQGGSQQAGKLVFLRRPAFALGIAVLALLVLTNLYWAARVSNLENQSKQFAALAQAPGITLRASDAGSGRYEGQSANGVVYVQPGGKLALLCVYALPQLEPDKTYQAWLVRDGQRVSAGTFGVNPNGYGVLVIDSSVPVSEYQQLGITVEPAGGSSAPTTPRVMGGEL